VCKYTDRNFTTLKAPYVYCFQTYNTDLATSKGKRPSTDCLLMRLQLYKQRYNSIQLSRNRRIRPHLKPSMSKSIDQTEHVRVPRTNRACHVRVPKQSDELTSMFPIPQTLPLARSQRHNQNNASILPYNSPSCKQAGREASNQARNRANPSLVH
jgi:hypothetical protein